MLKKHIEYKIDTCDFFLMVSYIILALGSMILFFGLLFVISHLIIAWAFTNLFFMALRATLIGVLLIFIAFVIKNIANKRKDRLIQYLNAVNSDD